MIGGQNPFFLSYLAVNPSLAHQYMYQTFDNPDFKLIVKCNSEEKDPLGAIKLDLKKIDKADENNVKYILNECDRTDDVSYIKGLYLSYNRDIAKTIDHLKK